MNMLFENSISHMPPNDKVFIMRVDLERIRDNYKALLYFSSRIIGKSQKEVTVNELRHFDHKRFHDHENFKKNLSFPVETYIERIKQLEEQLSK